MANAQVEKFRASLPPEESELMICPPDCREDHDHKWYGVTVPARKIDKNAPKAVRTPEIFRHTPPQDTVVWEDPYPTMPMKEWREKMKESGQSTWRHYEYPVQGKIVEMVPPTAKQLEKHARLYGVKSPATLASCHEVAAMYGISGHKINKPPPVKRGPRGLNQEEKTRQLVDLGYSWNVIEEELDLSRPKSIELKALILGEGAA